MVYYDRKTKITANSKDSLSLKFLYKTVLGRIILKIITRKSISKIMGLLTNTRISTIYIKHFIKKNNIDMTEFEEKKYNSFNDFFTRKLTKEIYPKEYKYNILTSPCSSKLQVYSITKDLIVNIKNSKYNITNLINEEISKDYKNGLCMIFRLSPEDYHRYHTFDNYTILNHKKIKGILHTVNPISYETYQVFTENNREVSLLKTENFNDVYQIEVGALNIGKINNNNKTKYKKYEEKGYFSFGGSTIILLFKNETIKVDKDIIENSKMNIETKVSYGETIGKAI